MATRFGASPEEWLHFSIGLGLTADLLPVVSNPHATISPQSKMKALGKTPSRYNSQHQAAGMAEWTQRESTPTQIETWSHEDDYGMCLQTREVRALDVDVTDPLVVQAIRQSVERCCVLPVRSRPNSPKCLFAFRLLGDYRKRVIRTAAGAIEFLGSGQQFVAVGTHPSGVCYEWEGGLPDDIPEIGAEQFEALWAELEATFATEPATVKANGSKQQALGEAITADPVAQFLISNGNYISAERDGRMHIICPFNEEHTSESSESATTYFPAHTNGYERGNFRCLHAHCEHRQRHEFLEALGFVDAEAIEFEPLVEAPAAPAAEADFEVVEPTGLAEPVAPHRFAVIPACEFAVFRRSRYLIKHVIPEAELVVVFGESGSGKTFMVLDLAMAVARGAPWRGNKVKQGRVVYIAAEGGGGVRDRLRAYAEQHDVDLATVPFGIINAAPNLLLRPEALEVGKQIGAGVSLIIIDTFAQTMPGGNENSGEDVGLALAHCKGLHRMTGATILMVHHAGKDSSKGARGWSGLRAAADAELEVVRDDNQRMLRITKQKDGIDDLKFGFELEVVVMGMDEDGEPVTSCVIGHTDRVPTDTHVTGKVQQAVLAALGDATGLLDKGVGQVALADAVMADSDVNVRRSTVTRAIKTMIKNGVLLLTSGGLRVATPVEEDE